MVYVRLDVATYLFLGSQIGLIENLAVRHRDGDFYFCLFNGNTEFFKGIYSGGINDAWVAWAAGFGECPIRPIKDGFQFAIQPGGDR